MKKLMNWLADSFAPKANELFNRKWIAGISSAMQKILPFILTGSLIFFYDAFKNLLPLVIKRYLPDLGAIALYSFFLIGLITAFMMGSELMRSLDYQRYKTTVGITSICLMFMFCIQAAPENTNILDRLGPSSILIAMISGLVTAIIFNAYIKLKVLHENTSLPEFVKDWINDIVPICLTLLFGTILTVMLKIDVYETIQAMFKPMQSFGQSLFGLIILVFVPAFFYSMGISSWLFSAITTPIFMAGIQENIEAVAQGLPAMNIVTNETVFTLSLIMMGGSGATLVLNVLMLKSKSKKLSTLGKICLGPSIFNINEPIVFGTPIVFNPILMVPMWINSIVGPIIIWVAMSNGLLNIPDKLMQIGQIPAPISSVMVTNGDLRAVLWFIVMVLVYLLVWYPFFKVYEKQVLAEESK